MLILTSLNNKKDSAKSCPTLAIPRTVARQALLSMGFSRQENWSGLLFSSPGDLPDPGIKPRSPAFQADALQTELNRTINNKITGQTKLKGKDTQPCEAPGITTEITMRLDLQNWELRTTFWNKSTRHCKERNLSTWL